MKENQNRLKWHMLFVITIMALAIGVYSVSQTINYNWQWKRVLPYIVDTSSVEIVAEYDGTAAISADGVITIHFDDTDQPLIITNADETLVADGDLVFEGDVLAHKNNKKMGILIEGLIVTLEC